MLITYLIYYFQDRSQVTNLMRLHLRLAVIRNEIELLENPEMRQIYEEINFQPMALTNGLDRCDHKANVFIVTKEDTIGHQMEYLDAAKLVIDAGKIVKIIPTLKVGPDIHFSILIYSPNTIFHLRNVWTLALPSIKSIYRLVVIS